MTQQEKAALNPFYIYLIKENSNATRGMGYLYYNPAKEFNSATSPLYNTEKWTYISAEEWYEQRYNIEAEKKVTLGDDWLDNALTPEKDGFKEDAFKDFDTNKVYIVPSSSGAPLWYFTYNGGWHGSNPLAYLRMYLEEPIYRLKNNLGTLISWEDYPGKNSADPYYYFIDKDNKYYYYNLVAKKWEEGRYTPS
jgi:hypothetical protein